MLKFDEQETRYIGLVFQVVKIQTSKIEEEDGLQGIENASKR